MLRRTALAACLFAAAPLAWAEVDFMNQVHPILAEHCYKCHAGDARKGGLQLDSKEAVLKGGENGPAAVEGNADASLLIKKVLSTDPDERMPPKGPALTPEEVATLSAWIAEGMPWNAAATTAKAPAYVAPLQLMETPPAPEGVNLVDNLLGAYMAERSIPEPETVPDALFARRAFLDTIGLLPTENALKEFTQSKEENKRAKLIDTLLRDNPDYAEHWISFWNDLLRNDFEGTGYIDGGRAPITDWLYQALLENKPYNQFVQELIDPRPASEGFIKGIVWRGDNATVQLPSMQAASNVAQVFLGINLKCASCHDSFVNRWKLVDSFGLANCFSDQPMGMVRCDTPTGEVAPYKFLYPELGGVDANLSLKQRRERIAQLVTMPENGAFSRTIVNRVWALLMGRGIVEPLDAIENEPWSAPLLDALARDFISSGYNIKHLLGVIMKSKAYGWKSNPVKPDPKQPFTFAGPSVRRMSAEQFYDALSRMTGVWHENPKFLKPEDRVDEQPRGDVRAWRLASDSLTRALGRTNREQVTTRRESAATTLQFLELTNGATLAQQIKKAARQLASAPDAQPRRTVLQLYRRGLQRSPSKEELGLAVELVGSPPSEEGIEDLLWAMVMLPEFQLIY